MTMDEYPRSGWNLFARVLQVILTAHGYGLGYLDDRAGMHPEKVRRLQRSLKVPKSFPVLNIYEMEQVKSAFRLNREETGRQWLPIFVQLVAIACSHMSIFVLAVVRLLTTCRLALRHP